MSMHPQELDLWQELKDALAVPQSADLKRLCQLLDWAIAQLPEQQQLDAAGQAIEQIAAVYTLKAEWLMTAWEMTHEITETSLPVLTSELIDGWIRQSMSIDLDAVVEQSISKCKQRSPKPQPTDSIAVDVDQASLLEMLNQMELEPDPEQMVRQLAEEEDPIQWSAAIMQWLQTHDVKQSVCLVDLYQELKMPLVEVWIGLLLGGFELEQHGHFYDLPGVQVYFR